MGDAAFQPDEFIVLKLALGTGALVERHRAPIAVIEAIALEFHMLLDQDELEAAQRASVHEGEGQTVQVAGLARLLDAESDESGESLWLGSGDAIEIAFEFHTEA